ncbi:MAG: halocyanin domain-containing protein, partial [Betaproteobacteria bacterium HGW-Betaproteobacteria-14]
GGGGGGGGGAGLMGEKSVPEVRRAGLRFAADVTFKLGL